MQAQRGNRDEDAGGARDRAGQNEGRGEGQAHALHQDGIGIAAEREKRRMAQACLSGMARQHHQAHARDGPDQDVGGLAQQKIVE